MYARGTVKITKELCLHKLCSLRQKSNNCLMVTFARLFANFLKYGPSAEMTTLQFTCCPLPTPQYHGCMVSANAAAPNFKYRPGLLFQCTTMGCKVLTGMISCDPDSRWRLGMGLNNITSRTSWPNWI
jgi:hypothetical protein